MRLKFVYIGFIVAFITVLFGSLASCGTMADNTGTETTIYKTVDDPQACQGDTPDECNGECFNLQTDEQNCGTCGNKCSSGEVCQNGECVSANGYEVDTSGNQEESTNNQRGIRIPPREILTAQPAEEGLVSTGGEPSATDNAGIVTEPSNRGVSETRPIGEGRTIVGGLDLPGAIVEHRYKIEALNFRCIQETGDTSLGSDEILVMFNDPARNFDTITGIYEDVDEGESRNFKSDNSCILPIGSPFQSASTAGRSYITSWTCSSEGVPGPFSFSVALYEMDRPNFGSACLGGPCPPIPDSGDELIGRRTLTFTSEELVAAMPNVYDTFDETVGLSGEGAEYTFTYRLTRLPDRVLKPEVNPGG